MRVPRLPRRVHQRGAARRAVARRWRGGVARPCRTTATTTFSAKSSKLTSSSSRSRARRCGSRWRRSRGRRPRGAADPSRATPGRPDHAARRARRGPGWRGSPRGPRRAPPIVSPSSSAPRMAAKRRAASSDAAQQALGLVDSIRVTQRSTTPSSIRSPAAEVEHRRLGEAADDLVGRGDDEVGAALEARRRAARARSAGARPTPRRRPAARRARARPRRARRRRRRRRSRWARRRARATAPGASRRARGPATGGVRQWAMPSSESSSGATKAGSRPARIEPVDRARVDVALHDHRAPAWRKRQAGRVVPLRGAVDQEPAAARPPGLGRQPLRRWNGVGSGGRRRSPRSGRGCRSPRPASRRCDQLRVRAGAALVTRDVEPARIPACVGDQRIQVRGPRLVHGGPCYAAAVPRSLRPAQAAAGLRVRRSRRDRRRSRSPLITCCRLWTTITLLVPGTIGAA